MVTAFCGQLALQTPQPLHEAAIVSDFFPLSVSTTLIALKGRGPRRGRSRCSVPDPLRRWWKNAHISLGHGCCCPGHGSFGLGDGFAYPLGVMRQTGQEDAIRCEVNGPQLHMGLQKESVRIQGHLQHLGQGLVSWGMMALAKTTRSGLKMTSSPRILSLTLSFRTESSTRRSGFESRSYWIKVIPAFSLQNRNVLSIRRFECPVEDRYLCPGILFLHLQGVFTAREQQIRLQ